MEVNPDISYGDWTPTVETVSENIDLTQVHKFANVLDIDEASGIEPASGFLDGVVLAIRCRTKLDQIDKHRPTIAEVIVAHEVGLDDDGSTTGDASPDTIGSGKQSVRIGPARHHREPVLRAL